MTPTEAVILYLVGAVAAFFAGWYSRAISEHRAALERGRRVTRALDTKLKLDTSDTGDYGPI